MRTSVSHVLGRSLKHFKYENIKKFKNYISNIKHGTYSTRFVQAANIIKEIINAFFFIINFTIIILINYIINRIELNEFTSNLNRLNYLVHFEQLSPLKKKYLEEQCYTFYRQYIISTHIKNRSLIHIIHTYAISFFLSNDNSDGYVYTQKSHKHSKDFGTQDNNAVWS